MTLPVTLTGISVDVATVGPYKSSGGNFYCFGVDASDATILQCFKATDPTDSWSSIASNTGFATAICDIAAIKKDDVIHIVLCDGLNYGQFNYKYRTFNMATDSFVVSETIAGPVNTNGVFDPPLSSVVVRSSGEAVVLLQADASGGDCVVGYSRRTGTNTWSAPAQVDAGGGQFLRPLAILGNSDEVHFLFSDGSTAYQRSLSSDNNLQTASTVSGNYSCSEGLSFDLSGTVRCVAAGSFFAGVLYFDSEDVPTLHWSSLGTGINARTVRLMERNFVVYALYAKSISGNMDYYCTSSTDGGAHWEPETFICHSTSYGALKSVSRFARMYPLVADVVVPFLYVDDTNTTLKHNHKIVSSIILQGQAAFLGGGSFLPTAIGGDFSAPLEDPFRLRFSIVNEGDALDAAPWQLYVSKNGGVYHAVTTTSDDAYSLNAGASPDETPIFIPRLSIPA